MPFCGEITSRTNPAVVAAVKLRDKKARDAAGLFCFEGRKLTEEILRSPLSLKTVFLTKKAMESYAGLCASFPSETNVYRVSEEVYDKLTLEKAPQGIFCIAEKGNTDYRTPRAGEKLLLCHCLQDPGNLGTVIRTARSLGIDTVILSRDCADVWQPKVVHAGMGAVFFQNIGVTDDMTETVGDLRRNGFHVYAAALHRNAVMLPDLSAGENTVFAVGNEGHGLPEELIEACDGTVMIPMAEGAESLNASVAAGILMWECVRGGR